MTTRVLIERQAIAERITALGQEITRYYADCPSLTIVVVLKGSFVFAADLIRAIQLPVEVDFLGVRSYGDEAVSSGVVQITQDLSRSIEGKDVLIVEDIVDTGLTLSYLMRTLGARRPRSLRLAAFLHKPARTRVAVTIDHLGFTIEDVFVVGYGLDHAQRHRNLPHVAVLELQENRP